MSGSGRKLGAVAAVTCLLFTGVVAPVGATAAAGNTGGTVVTAGNVVYQTDSGLTVTDGTSADVASGNPFTDHYTLELSGLTLSAAGNAPAAVTVDQRTGTETRLSAIDTSSTDVTVDPDDKQSVTIGGGLLTLDYRDPSFEVAGVDIDFDYTADSTASLTYPNSGLADRTAIEVIDTSNGNVLDTAMADPSGLLGFTALPSGTYTVNASETDTEVPVAATGADVTVDEDMSVGFDASGSSDDGAIGSYEWDWTNDGTYEESGQTASHTYADPGTYTATLRVTDGAGRSDSDTRTVTVRDTTPPTATTGSDVTVDEDTSVAFDASGSTDNGNIVSYEWDWTGDGTYEGSGQTASHSYADPGTYTATLLVTDNGGNTNTAQRTVTVRDTTPPTATTGSDITVDEDTSVSFDASGSADNDNIVGYEWDWTGDGTYEGSGQTASHTYTNPGTYTVTLRVTDGGGNTHTAQRTVTVETVGGDSGGGGGGGTDTTDPTARTQPNVTIDAGTTLTFDGSNSTDNDDVWAHEWDFDRDGTYEKRGITVSHNYTEPGTYTATLRVTDHDGNTDTALRMVTVQAVNESEQTNSTDTVNDEEDPDSAGDDSGPVNSGDGGTTTETPSTTTTPPVTNTGTAGITENDPQETATGGNGPLSPVLVVVAIVLVLLVHRQRERV